MGRAVSGQCQSYRHCASVPPSLDHLARRSPASLRGERTALTLPGWAQITHPTWDLVMCVSIANHNRPINHWALTRRRDLLWSPNRLELPHYPTELCGLTGEEEKRTNSWDATSYEAKETILRGGPGKKQDR